MQLAELLGIEGTVESLPPAGIAQARLEPASARCHVPEALREARLWGLTCQLPSLASARNLGMGDFADLADLCRIVAAEGADFVGINPLHALFWSDPARISPFSPSNRRFLNPLYIAPEWVEGFDGPDPYTVSEAQRLRVRPMIDPTGAARVKDRCLRQLFDTFPWCDETVREFRAFRDEGGSALEAHAQFEAVSAAMVATRKGAGWLSWPAGLRDRRSREVAALAAVNRPQVDYHLWLQWQAGRQARRVQSAAREAGMRIGLYLDFAVGVAPDGSAAWSDPELPVSGASIGAPPDHFSPHGQNWGLAPLSPIRLGESDCRPLAEVMAAVMRPAGAVRIDHAMSLYRLWLIPHGKNATEGAYVQYPLERMLSRLAESSRARGTLVIGEDLGVVPPGFRALMAERDIHAFKVFFYERGPTGFDRPRTWPVNALACLATHDMPTFTGWWRGDDLRLRRALGMLTAEDETAERIHRVEDRAAVRALTAPAVSEPRISARLHARIADSPSRLAALQLEDALGLETQVNVPGTVDEYPNWRRRLPVRLDEFCDHPGFRAHVAAMRSVRPK